MRYIQVPEPFRIIDPVENELIDKIPPMTFTKIVCGAVAMAAQQAEADALTLADIRAKALELSAGTLWEIPDDWHKILADQCRRPRFLSPAVILSGATHLRAILDAPSKRPEALVERSNGVEAAAS